MKTTTAETRVKAAARMLRAPMGAGADISNHVAATFSVVESNNARQSAALVSFSPVRGLSVVGD